LPALSANTVVPPPSGTTPPPDMGAADGGAADGGTTDYFPLDGRFICSDKINGTGTAFSQRIDGLENGQEYEVLVVSIDPYGNPAASDVQVGVPRESENPLAPYCKENNGVCPTGFGCQAAASPVGAGALSLMFLGGCLVIYRQMRGRRREKVSGRAA
jgi:hypothetical protein